MASLGWSRAGRVEPVREAPPVPRALPVRLLRELVTRIPGLFLPWGRFPRQLRPGPANVGMAERGGGAGGEEGWGCCSASSGLLLPAALAPRGGPRAGCAVRPGRPYRCGQPRAGAPAGAVPPCCPQITRPPAPPRPRAPPGSSRSLPAAAATRAPKGCGATEATDPVTDTAPPARGSWKDCRSNR